MPDSVTSLSECERGERPSKPWATWHASPRPRPPAPGRLEPVPEFKEDDDAGPPRWRRCLAGTRSACLSPCFLGMATVLMTATGLLCLLLGLTPLDQGGEPSVPLVVIGAIACLPFAAALLCVAVVLVVFFTRPLVESFQDGYRNAR